MAIRLNRNDLQRLTKGESISSLSKELGISKSTLYRKRNAVRIVINEIKRLKEEM